MIISSLYFSGLRHEVDYMCPFPGHNPAIPSATNKSFDALMSTLGKCFNKTYLPDSIVRHAASAKSQPIRAADRTFRNHLNTLHLNCHPQIYGRKPRKGPIQLRDEKVLVVDDICTRGRSLDVARAYIDAAGGSAVLFVWLKTIRVAFAHMRRPPALRPFVVNQIAAEPSAVEYNYSSCIVSQNAAAEIGKALTACKQWKWP
jgi:predicted amidophosphoribosyltransferase